MKKQEKGPDFVCLHQHSTYSICDGLNQPAQIAEYIAKAEMPAAALTEHGNMASSYAWAESCKKQGVHPIIGMEAYFVASVEPDQNGDRARSARHLILLAQNQKGYQNLLKLSKRSYSDGFYYSPRIDYKMLEQHNEGLIALSACLNGVLSRVAVSNKGQGERAVDKLLVPEARRFQDIFGDRYYVELQMHDHDDQRMANQAFLRLKKQGVQLVVTTDSHYLNKDQSEVQQIMVKIGRPFTKKKELEAQANDANALTTAVQHKTLTTLFPMTYGELRRQAKIYHPYLSRSDFDSMVANTSAIYDRVKGWTLPLGGRHLPHFTHEEMRKTENSKQFLLRLLSRGLNEKGLTGERVYLQRLKTELEVIQAKGFEDYFLIVWDFISWAQKRGIWTGIGRGSAAGSLISYLLNITQVDPIEYKLFFERFLNPSRDDLPDIDVDIEMARREEVKQYIIKRYGNVAGIAAYSRLKGKAAVKEVAKAMDLGDFQAINKKTKGITVDKEDKSVKEIEEHNPDLKKWFDENPSLRTNSYQAYNQIRSATIHPAGMLISPSPIEDLVPVKFQKAPNSKEKIMVSQWEDKYVLAAGMLKMDVLGLAEYDILKMANGLAGTGFNSISEIPVNDDEVFKRFRKADTTAIFQFASDGMRELLKKMKPDCVNDLIAANALYRPGSLDNDFHTDYCDRKWGRQAVHYPHASVEPDLKETYGLFVYQEQVMAVLHKLGGISLAETDTIRSALGKKIKEKLDKYRPMFVAGAAKKIGAKKAEALWDQIEKASGYNFNKCQKWSTIIYRHKGKHKTSLNVGDMYKLMNGDRENSRRMGHEALYKKMKREGYGKGWSLCDDGRLRPNKIVDIRYEGVRPIFKVTTESGKSIEVTMNHKFPTPKGELELYELAVGDLLFVNAGYEQEDTVHRFTKRKGSTDVVGVNAIRGKSGFQKVPGSSWSILKERRAIIKAMHKKCAFCSKPFGENSRLEVHHRDGDHGNQDWGNLIPSCSGCHKRRHYEMGRTKRGEKGLLCQAEKIASIEFTGLDDVYDVEMEGPNHNLVVNDGIVTSNSHSTVYSTIAYCSMWFRHYHPAAFWASAMTFEMDGSDRDVKLPEYRVAAGKDGMKFRKLSVNKSDYVFKIDDGRIRWALGAVKGLGEQACREIVKNQPYASPFDFFKRATSQKKQVEALIFAGAFWEFGTPEEVMRQYYKYREVKKQRPFEYPADYEGHNKFWWEKKKFDQIGFFASPLKELWLSKLSGDEMTLKEWQDAEDDAYCSLAGMVSDVHKLKTKKGDEMAFVTLIDSGESFSLTFFPQQYELYMPYLKEGFVLQARGRRNTYNGRSSLVIDKIKLISG